MTLCRHCQRAIVYDEKDGWIDPRASGDDAVWRETCDEHDTFEARHEPDDEGPLDDDWIQARAERAARAGRPQTTSEMMLEDLRLEGPPY